MKTLTFRLIEGYTEIFTLSGRVESIEGVDSGISLDCVNGTLEDRKLMRKLMPLRNGHYSIIQNIYDSLLNLANHKKIDNYKILTEIK